MGNGGGTGAKKFRSGRGMKTDGCHVCNVRRENTGGTATWD